MGKKHILNFIPAMLQNPNASLAEETKRIRGPSINGK
jgi:hypothetical protein